MFVIYIKGRGFFKWFNKCNSKYPVTQVYQTIEEANRVISYWDSLHSSFNHTVEYVHKKDKKGRNVCDIIHTKLETTIVDLEE